MLFRSLSANTLTAAIQSAKTAIYAALAPLTNAMTLDLTLNDPVSKAFTPDNTGLDKLLDAVEVKITPGDNITITNRFEKVTESAGTSERTSVVISFAGQVTGALPISTNRDLSWIPTLAQSFTDCFALSAAQRIVYTTDAAGVPVASSVHNTCKSFVSNTYLHNGYSYGDRWALVLRDSAFNNAKFKINLVYVVDRNGSDAYVINVNFKDQDGNGYTRPEVVMLNGAAYQLMGNGRQIEAYTEPVITNISDYVSSTSSTNRIEGRIRLMFTPHRDSDGVGGYKFFYDSANKPDPIWACSWVTGPGLPGEGAQNSGQTGPLGGVLLKIPKSDATQRREFLAIAYKFPATFDPVGTQADRNQLVKACTERVWVSNPPAPAVAGAGRFEVATNSIYNNFAIDYAKLEIGRAHV